MEFCIIMPSWENDSSCDIDEDVEDFDEAQGRHYGWCRGCKSMQPDCSNDDGWCGDCN